MNRSGIKRGLAISAVAALGVVGVPGLASATSLPVQNGGANSSALSFYTGGHNYASTKNGATVHLLAAGGGLVKQVKFSYQVGAEPAVTIQTVTSATNDAFSYDWTPPAAIAGATVTLTAQGLDASGTAVGTAQTKLVTIGTGQPPVTVSNAAGSSVGLYDVPGDGTVDYTGIVSGSILATSTTGAPSVAALSPSGAEAPADQYTAPTGTTPTATSFSGIADFGNYPWDSATTGAVDEAVVGAYGPGLTSDDDEQPVKVYQQQVKGIAPDAAVKTVAQGSNGSVTVTVIDQNGNPIANAPVIIYPDSTPGAASDVTDSASTNSKGQATFTGLAGTPSGTKYDIAADVNGDGAYTNGTDYRTQVTIATYAPTLTTLTATPDSTLGTAFDKDEYAGHPIKVTAKDQNNNTTAIPATVVGQWTVTPFDSTHAAVSPFPAVINSDGTVQSPYGTAGSVPGTYTLNVWNETDGTPGESAGDTKAAPLSVKIGEAAVKFDSPRIQAAPATTVNDSGKLVLEDGTALPGRTLTFSLTPGTGDHNAQFVPAANSSDTTTSITRTTDASGAYSFQVKDPAVTSGTQGEESDVEITGTGTGFTAGTQRIDFVSTTVGTVAAAQSAGPEGYNNEGQPTPGRPVQYTFTVTNGNGAPLTNQAVSVSVNNNAFLTEVSGGNLVPAATPTSDTTKVGAWKNDGASKTYTTDANGEVTVYVAEEKNTDFDNDGQAKVGVTATVGGKSDTENVFFSSEDPLNIGTAKLVYGDDSDSSSLPKAQFDTDEYVAAQVTDQFGNLVQDVPVSLTDTNTSDQASFTDDTIYSSTTNGSADGDNPESRVYVDQDGYVGDSLTQTVKGTATWSGVEYKDSDPVTTGFQYAPTSTQPVSETADAGSLEFDWYAADASKATVTAAHTPTNNPEAPGSLVTETITVTDSAGVPVKDGSVDIFLTGTGNPFFDGQSRSADNNGDGTYSLTFQGPQSGTVTVQAQAKDSNGKVLGQTASDSIEFGTTPPPPPPAKPTITNIKGGGAKTDIITVSVKNGNGKRVNLVRGGKVIAHSAVVNGKVVFKVKDLNGNKVTRYIAKIAKSSKSVRVK